MKFIFLLVLLVFMLKFVLQISKINNKFKFKMGKINKPQRVQIGKDLIENEDLDKYSLYLHLVLSVYADKDTKQCFPSLDTLAKDTKASKATVIKRLNNLKDKGFITILNRGRKGNLYTLIKPPKLLKDKEEFTIEFIKRDDLTIEEKIFFICTAPKTSKDENTGMGEIKNVSVNKLAKWCGMSWGSTNKIINSLIQKSTIKFDKDLTIDYTKIGQAMLFMVAQIQENTEDIAEIKEELKEFRKFKDEFKEWREKQRKMEMQLKNNIEVVNYEEIK
jgi:biotin operon repressor/flagellar motility protein MotE (MotC chaperone)|nr:MAG TPA: helix-turn-helix domain protein [Crassvirales sp.]